MSSTSDEPFLPADADDRAARVGLVDLRADLPSALRLALPVVLAGVLVGLAWALLAPGVGTVSLPGGASGALPGENDHAFDAVAVFVLLAVSYGILAGVLAWRRRADRGPVMLLGVVLAALVGALVASRVGVWLAAGPVLPPPVGVLIDRAAASAGQSPSGPGPAGSPTLPATLSVAPPSPGPWWAALVAGLAAALTYVIAAIADGHEDPRSP